MTYEIIKTSLPEILILKPKIYNDQRGYFFESFNQQAFYNATGSSELFVQDNQSQSVKGVLRGLHYQIPNPQGKLVRVTKGIAYDVAVDIRRSSANFGKWTGIELSSENNYQLWIPVGFAHGFMAISESVEFIYKTTDYWSPDCEQCLLWSDPEVDISWPRVGSLLINEKDRNGKKLSEIKCFD